VATARDASAAEAFGWLATFTWGGYSAGTAIPGAVRGPTGAAGLGIAGIAGVLVAVTLAIRFGRDIRLAPRPHATAQS
jgi:hypothetical protein